MRKISETKIFAETRASEFVGRNEQLEKLLRHARSESSSGLVLLAAPSCGASEMLRQVYDRLFVEQDQLIPFYFEVRDSDRTAQGLAVRFLCEFLLQTVAFRRRDPRIIDASPELAEIAELAVPIDGYWIDRLVETYNGEASAIDSRSFIRNCLSAPLRAAAREARAFLMIDDVHKASQLDGGENLLTDIVEIYGRGGVPFVLSGPRRAMFARTPFNTVSVEPFSFLEGGRFTELLSSRSGVDVTDQTRDLISVQLGGSAGHITSLFAAAAARGRKLDTFENVEQIYTDEIFGGRICKHFDRVFDQIVPDLDVQTKMLEILTENLRAGNGKVPLSYWKKHAGLDTANFDALLAGMNENEIVNVGSGSVEIDASNILLSDYIRARVLLEIDGEPRALAVGETLSANLKRAPQLMARFYRKNSALGLRWLMKYFDGRSLSNGFFEYARFNSEFKGMDDDQMMSALSADGSTIVLPQIVYSADTAAFYPQLNEICDPERSAVALGFREGQEKQEIAWIAVEIDSKLEATREVAEFWCDRLEMAAVSCNFENYKIWLIAPEGFAPDAMDVLQSRNAIGSSRKQFSLLEDVFDVPTTSTSTKSAHEYEIVVPMGEDTEMLAAHTVEEIAKRYHFPPKAINQIKTALVEACINASEHSLSPDRKIHQLFAVDADKITVTVSNRGLRLSDKKPREISPDEGRRGWGLKLIKGLMDEVKLEQTDDGTRITMVKYLQNGQGK